MKLIAIFAISILFSMMFLSSVEAKPIPKTIISFNVTANVGQKSAIIFRACNFSQSNPDFRITSDSELGLIYKLTDGRTYNNSCTRDLMVMVKAKDPKTIQIKLEPRDKAGDSPMIIIKTINPTKMPERYQVIFKICAAKKALQNPTVLVQSDESEEYVSVISRIGTSTCQTKDVMVFANDPHSIKIEILGAKNPQLPNSTPTPTSFSKFMTEVNQKQ